MWDFEDWFEELCRILHDFPDRNIAKEDYENGLTPEESAEGFQEASI